MSAGKCGDAERGPDSTTRDVGACTNLSVLCPASFPGGTVPHSWRNARYWRPCPTKTFSGVKRLVGRNFFRGCPSGTRLWREESNSTAQRSSPRSAFQSMWLSLLLVAAKFVLMCVCACVYAYVSTHAALSPRRFCRCGSDCGFEPGCHDANAREVRCSPVGWELMTGHLLLLPGTPAACVKSQSTSGDHFRLAPLNYIFNSGPLQCSIKI